MLCTKYSYFWGDVKGGISLTVRHSGYICIVFFNNSANLAASDRADGSSPWGCTLGNILYCEWDGKDEADLVHFLIPMAIMA